MWWWRWLLSFATSQQCSFKLCPCTGTLILIQESVFQSNWHCMTDTSAKMSVVKIQGWVFFPTLFLSLHHSVQSETCMSSVSQSDIHNRQCTWCAWMYLQSVKPPCVLPDLNHQVATRFTGRKETVILRVFLARSCVALCDTTIWCAFVHICKYIYWCLRMLPTHKQLNICLGINMHCKKFPSRKQQLSLGTNVALFLNEQSIQIPSSYTCAARRLSVLCCLAFFVKSLFSDATCK